MALAGFVVAILLVAYVALTAIIPLMRKRRATAPARQRMSRSIAEGADDKRSKEDRARAFVTAGKTALDDLGRPRLAARYAEWAHRLTPADPDVVALLVGSMRASKRYHALERLLWVSLDASETPRTSPARAALEALYEKELGRPERARALRKLVG
jgi:hypothetical protein